MKYNWLETARFLSWNHYRLWTPDEMREQARKAKEYGANTLITFGHHYRFDSVDIWKEHAQSLKTIVEICHELGMRVIEHHSATFVPVKNINKVIDGISLADCRLIDARDNKPPFFDEYQIYMLCCNNPNFRKVYFDYVLNLVKDTGVDGLMSDDIEFCPTWHSCTCEHCRSKFNQETGDTIPEGDSPAWGNFDDPWFRRWLRFRMKSVGDYYVDLRKAMDDAGLEIPLLGCLAGTANRHLAQMWGQTGEEFARGVDINFYEAWHNTNNMLLWRTQASEINYYLAISRHRQQQMFTLHYIKNADEQFFVWALNLLVGDRLWLGAPVHHPEQTYQWESKYQELFTSPQPIANIAVLFSRQTRDVYGGYDDKYYIHEWLGWSQMLLEENISAHTLCDSDLAGDLSRYQLLILPNAACLSEAQVAGIRRYLAQGGKVIATYDTATRDETGALLEKSALSDWIQNPPAGFTYYADKVGATQLYETPYFNGDDTEEEWVDTRDWEMRKKLLADVKSNLSSLPWEILEGDGILANLHQVNDRLQVAHLLNVKPLDLGGKALIQKKCKMDYDAESLAGPVVLRVQGTLPKSVFLVSPDNQDPVALEPKADGDRWTVRVEKDQIRRYGVIKIEK